MTSVVENLTVMPKRTTAEEAGLGRTERIITVKEPSKIEDLLLKNGFTEKMIEAISGTSDLFPTDAATERSTKPLTS